MLEAVLEAVKSVAHSEIMPRYQKVARQRKNDGSVFTEADIAAQTALVSRLRAIRRCPVLGEEMHLQLQEKRWHEGSEGLWCIDPIDGTSNFVNGVPIFAVSVALLREGRPALGVVYNPATQEIFYAEKGGGAYMNGERLTPRVPVEEIPAIAGIDFKRLPGTLIRRLLLSPPYRSQRNMGSSALDWCYVACGRYDVYLHGGQMLWDYAAGSLILEEAGGHMCSLDYGEFWAGELWRRSVIAGLDQRMFEAWKAWLQQG